MKNVKAIRQAIADYEEAIEGGYGPKLDRARQKLVRLVLDQHSKLATEMGQPKGLERYLEGESEVRFMCLFDGRLLEIGCPQALPGRKPCTQIYIYDLPTVDVQLGMRG